MVLDIIVETYDDIPEMTPETDGEDSENEVHIGNKNIYE